MGADDGDRGDRPEYNVYRGGKTRGGDGKSRKPKPSRGGSRAGARADAGKPDYEVYRSRRNPFAGLKGADLGALRERLGSERKERRRSEVARSLGPEKPPTWRRVLRYVLIGAGFWLLLSIALFAVSAQIQKSKLNNDADELLGAAPLMVASPQTILVVGTDARPQATGAVEAETRSKCIEQGATGDPPSADCSGFRADTLMLVRAGGGKFSKLSIPRDVLAEVPGRGPQKINSAYATGGAALQIQTVEDFLGIEVDHLVLLDFQGFADFIDSIGGVEVNVTSRLKSKIDGGSGQGGITLKLDKGKADLDGDRALAFARARTNLRNPNETDLDRARRQQQVLAAIKGRLTSPWRLPINFARGPWIAWNAPKAMVTDMGAGTLPQLAISVAIGGDSGTKIIGKKGASQTAAGNLSIPQEACERAVRKFLGEPGPRTPGCSPVG